VRQQQHALGDGRAEPSDEVPQGERVASLRDVDPGLNLDRVGGAPQVVEDPVAGTAMRLGSGDAGAERHLFLHVAQRRGTIERGGGVRSSGAGERQQHGEDQAASHRICPDRKKISANTVTVSCE
jgi:hypothetical protein